MTEELTNPQTLQLFTSSSKQHTKLLSGPGWEWMCCPFFITIIKVLTAAVV
jgi:hypothetical protein